MNLFVIALMLVCLSLTISAQWIKQAVDTTANFRGLSVVNEKVIWASGSNGNVIRTIDGGKTWMVMQVPDASSKLDFRDIEAFDANTAYILSIGNEEDSRIYKTENGGRTWDLQFENLDPKAFFDAIACWDKDNCIAVSDPVDGEYVLISTSDGGADWSLLGTDKMAEAKAGEAAFAASGTCLITQGKNTVFLVTGGSDARVFRSNNRGLTWFVADTPITHGTPASGIFSIAMYDANNGVIVGGDYEKPAVKNNNLAFTTDGGKTWTPGTQLAGYRSGVTYLDRKTIIAAGTSGSDISRDGGRTWTQIDRSDLNAVEAKGKRAIWAVGPKGMVAKMK